MTKKDSEPAKPSLYHKTISGANWGMLAGFWVELPLMAAFLFKPFKPKNLTGWAKVSEWSVKLVLPATLAGVAYGFTKPDRDAKATARLAEILSHEDTLATRTNWAKAEEKRRIEAEDSHLQL
jgi:hypothetical protein